MKAISAFVKRYPLAIFVLLAYLLSWSIAVFIPRVLLPWGPMVAALIVAGISGGKAGIKAWWSRVLRCDTAWGWVLLAASLPLVITFMAAGLNLLVGGHVTKAIDWTVPFFALPIMLLVSGMWEEPGWTGFALPHLLERFATSPYGTLIATLIMAAIRTGWHLPLMLSGGISWWDIGSILAVQVVISWLFNRTGGSVLAIMLLHLLNNTISGEFVSQWFSGADWVRQSWLLGILWGLLALGVLIFTGLRLGRKSPTASQESKMTEPALNVR